jgi:hypothetical protein
MYVDLKFGIFGRECVKGRSDVRIFGDIHKYQPISYQLSAAEGLYSKYGN